MAARSAKYMYQSSRAGHGGDISIEYGTDLGALTRLEVCYTSIEHLILK